MAHEPFALRCRDDDMHSCQMCEHRGQLVFEINTGMRLSCQDRLQDSQGYQQVLKTTCAQSEVFGNRLHMGDQFYGDFSLS